ncbi:hypothetical protein KFL_003720140 [Klebsormidium nitens]|uniref:Uncharacterized protein n=1 Tax=Klebsormidium nitens TaxID=105231 RepID=A0A1Y1IAZ1_KLENI|nr:hypothetical protein KFL_003720140 [Klebsormidium nitens]|eukprot:GAQ87723.1 hypothetical protein KFL_003720140 [Klebsormidium nitens]
MLVENALGTSMEHQAALESLLEVYEALRKAVRAQLDGTGSHAVHRGRADLQARAIREALQVLAAETSALEGGPQDGGRTPPPGEKETKLLQGHVQVFQALWEHISGELVLCLGQADLPEVAGLLQCAQESHSDFLKRVSWPAAVPATPPPQNDLRESAGKEQIQVLVLENQRLQRTIQELAGWGNPGPLEKPPPLVIPPTPATPGGSVDPGSFSPSPQNPNPRKSEALAAPLLLQRPRARTEDMTLLQGDSGVPKRPSPKAFLPPGNGVERAPADQDRAGASGREASEGLHRARTLGADVSDKHADVSNRLQRSASTRVTPNADVSGAGGGGEARASKAGRKSATAAALRASAEQMLGSFRRMLHTSGGAGGGSDLPGGEVVEAAKTKALGSIMRGNSWFGKEGNGRLKSRQDGAIGRTRSNTVAGYKTSPRRTPSGRITPRTTPPEQAQHPTFSLSRGVARQSMSSPVPPPETANPAASPRFDFSPPLSPSQADIPDGWERFAEVSIPSTPRGEVGIWSIAPTPTAARAALIAATGGSAALLERGGGANLPLGEQPTNVSPGGKVAVLIPGPFRSEKPLQNFPSESAREDAPGGAEQSEPQPGFTPPGPGFSSSGNGFTPPGQGSTIGMISEPPVQWEMQDAAEHDLRNIPETENDEAANLGEGSAEPAAIDSEYFSHPEDDVSAANGGEHDNSETGVSPCSERILALRDRLLGDQESLPKLSQSPQNRLSGRGSSSERHVSSDERENKDPFEGSSQRMAKNGGALERGRSAPQQKLAPGGGFMRRMSLKELKVLIEEVYASKEKRDARCLACGLPKETLEQHLLSFLTQKFGLRALIAEWLAAALTAVAAFSPADAQVDVFGKILLNELDEAASLSYEHLRKSLEHAVAEQMRAKHPYAPVDDIAAIVNAAMRGAVGMQDAAALAHALFASPDSDVIIRKIEEHCQETARRFAPVAKGPASSSRVTRRRSYARIRSAPSKVAISDLLQILLRYHSDVRWLALRPLVRAFPSYSGGGPALCSDADLVALFGLFHPDLTEADVRRLLRWAQEVSGEGPVTFSDTVVLLTKAAGEFGMEQRASS